MDLLRNILQKLANENALQFISKFERKSAYH
jgi:ribosomal protein S25